MIKLILRCLSVVFLLIYAALSIARPDFLGEWNSKYPNSNSNDMGCQLCHANTGGGSPWNGYGWEIRSIYRSNNFDIEAALDAAENIDLDGDPIAATALDDIRAGFQPGWTEGANNTLYAVGSQTTGNSPPIPPATTAIDFPTAVINPIPDITLGAVDLALIEVATGLNAPVRTVRAPGIDGSLFVVEQTGKIYRVDLITGVKSLFLDVSQDLVDVRAAYDERGLLGLAFHPNYQINGLFYTYQSEPVRVEQDGMVDFSSLSPSATPEHRSMVVEYRAADASCNSSISKLETLMIIDQPQSNHNGGDLAFGQDGYLYVALGDGGGANDQGPGHNFNGAGRDNTNVLGSILRVDTAGANSANAKYGVPNDNPFTANGDAGVDEIFAYGLRNPYRMSFDATTGQLYTGDVGQNQVEEINEVVSGGNYGWNWKEGSFYFYYPGGVNFISNFAAPGSPINLLEPIGEYDHGDGISITGGYVYRGNEITEAAGHYVFGDFSGPNFSTPSGRLFYLNLDTNVVNEFDLSVALTGYVTGFGQDSNNELYVVTNDQFNPSGVEGKLLRLANPASAPSFPGGEGESAQCPAEDEMCVPIRTTSGAVSIICL